MYRSLTIALLLAMSCDGGGGDEASFAPPRNQPEAPRPAADAGVVATPAPKQSLAQELRQYQLERRRHRAEVSKIKTGRPLAKTAAGKTAYRTFVRLHTTTAISIDRLRALVQGELTAAEAELRTSIGQLVDVPEGTFAARRRSIAARETRPHLAIARAAQKTALAAAKNLFTKVPTASVIEVGRWRRSPLAFYAGGRVWLNLHRLNRPPAHLVEAIIFHETVPGHHLESTRSNKAPPAPDAPKQNDSASVWPLNGFIEGWGLYAEQLAADLNLYSNDLARIGHLELRAWRAARAAVDIGLHHDGWPLERARKFMAKHTVLNRTTIRVEINRVLHRPGRMQAYVVGADHILALRKRAATQLGPLFSLPAFHSVILGNGRIPLTSLDRLVSEWIDRVRANQRA